MTDGLLLRALSTSLWSGYVVLLHVTLFLLGAWLVRAPLNRADPAVRARTHACTLLGVLAVVVLCWLPVGWWWAWVRLDRLIEPFTSIGAVSIVDGAGTTPSTWILAAVWALYSVGVAIFLCRVAMRCRFMYDVSRRAVPATDAEWQRLLRDACAQMGTRRAVELRRSAEVATAVTWGAFVPVILVPDGADAWPLEHRRLVLLHELAHIRRGDWLVRVLAQLSLALSWFHPGAWASLRGLVTAQEEACDALVVRVGARRSEYAACLLRAADWAGGRGDSITSDLALGITSPPHIHRRVQQLVRAPHAAPSRFVQLGSVAAVLVWVLVAGSIRLAPRGDVMSQVLESIDGTRRTDSAAFRSRMESPSSQAGRADRGEGESSALVRAILYRLPH